MKSKTTIKTLVMLLLVPAFYSSLQAQEFKTNESIRSQLMKGTAPGLQFAPKAAVKKQADDNKAPGKESFITQVRKGIAPNMKFKTSQGGGNIANSAAAATQPKYASDLPAKKEAPVKAAPLQISSQDGTGAKNN